MSNNPSLRQIIDLTLSNTPQDFNIYAEPPADHLPNIDAGTVTGGWFIRCQCGLLFRHGDRWTDRDKSGKKVNRTIRTLTNARDAHRVHFVERTRSR